MTTEYQIHILKAGETLVPSAEVLWMSKLIGWERLCFWNVLLTNQERKVLINTGFARDFSDLHKFWTEWSMRTTGEHSHIPVIDNDNWVVNQLATQSVSPADITDIFLMPLTAYTTGGLDQFPNARIWMLRQGWIDFQAPDPDIPQLPRHITMPNHVLSWLILEAFDRLRLLPNEHSDPLPGITTWFSGSHHRSSMTLIADTQAGRFAFTDSFFTFRNYDNNTPLGSSESVEEHYRLTAQLRTSGAKIFPLYEPTIGERYPGLSVDPKF